MCRGDAIVHRSSGSTDGRSELERLTAVYADLVKGGRLNDVSSYVAYLRHVELCAEALEVDIAPRSFRLGYTTNYRALFNSGSGRRRWYRADLLEACWMACPTMCVNGEIYHFSLLAVEQSGKLKHSFARLGNVLDGHIGTTKYSWSAAEVRRVKAMLKDVDLSWAAFESVFIGELIGIESLARQPLLDAV